MAIEGWNNAQYVRSVIGFDPCQQQGFGAIEYAILHYIQEANQITVGDLLLCGLATKQEVSEALLRLLDWNAVVAEGSIGTWEEEDSIQIIDRTQLDAPTEDEQVFLAEKSDLLEWEKRSILSMKRLLDAGAYYEALGITKDATRSAIKRAYFEVSKLYHPDRYYGKQLGQLAPVLSQVFETLNNQVKQLASGRHRSGRSVRRLAQRYVLHCPVAVQCESWNSIEQTLTADVSEGGMFVLTKRPARPSDRVRIEIRLPSGEPLRLAGRVAFRITENVANDTGRSAGMGIALFAMSDPTREAYQALLDKARSDVIAPESRAEASFPVERSGWRNRAGREVIIGIDFGTTNTAASAVCGDRVRVLPWVDGSRSIPSVVSFPSRGECVVGQEARNLFVRYPRTTICSPKRLLGRQASDPSLSGYLAQAAYKTTTAPDGTIAVSLWDNHYAIAQICSYILRAVKQNAERVLEARVKQAVFTIPVTFTARQIELLCRAARFVGLEAVEIIDEPSAAALANRYYNRFDGVVGVYDFGGGTFDFSIVDVSAGDFDVLGTSGDRWLGGDDFDLAMANEVADRFWRYYNVDLRKRTVEWQGLVHACERSKRALTNSEETTLSVPNVLRTVEGMHDFEIPLTRTIAERLWQSEITRALRVCTSALQQIGLKTNDLSGIYLSGGTSYVPSVHQAVRTGLGVPTTMGVPPEFAACLGAGIHAAQIVGKKPI